MSKRDYYQVLGITSSATEDEIKQAYRRLAMQLHPDRNPDDASAEGKFKEVGEAYQHLSDPEKRAQYDAYNRSGSESNPFTHGRTRSWSYTADRASPDMDMSDIFKSFFDIDSTDPAFNQPRQQHIHVVTISLADAYIGKTISIDGTHSIYIPRGARSGTKFYAEGRTFRVDILPDPKFKRSNDDLLVDVTIDAIEAILGVETILSHLDCVKLQFNIPAGIQPGQIVKLAGKGMKNPETDKVGDILVRITVTIPKVLTDTQKDILKSLTHRSLINI
jgi:DnaJ-class molecular chaperone